MTVCIWTLQNSLIMLDLKSYNQEVVLQCMLDNIADRLSMVSWKVAMTPWWPINWQPPLSEIPRGDRSLEAVTTRWNRDPLIKEWVQKELVCHTLRQIMTELIL